MNAFRKKHEEQQKAYDSSMRKPLIFSVAFHIFVVVIGTLGLPYFVTKPEPREVAITIEMADIDVVSQTDVLAPPKPVKEPKEEPEPKPETKLKYQQTKAEEEPEEEKQPEPPKPDVKEEIPEPPKPDVKKEEKKEEEKKEKPKPLPPKPKNKPKPPKPKKPKEEKKEDELDMTKLLSTLTDESSEPETPKTEEKPEKVETGQQVSQIARVTGKLTRSEKDNIENIVRPCWIVNAGGKYAETLLVSLEVTFNPDMTVRNVRILDNMRYSSDFAFRAAADSARNALLNPTCAKPLLPVDKYNEYKVLTITFDPSQML